MADNKLSFKGFDRETEKMVFSTEVGLTRFFDLVDDDRIDIEKVAQLVCRDKNGKPVYAGDEVMLGKWQGKIELNLVDGAMIVTESHRFRLSTWKHHEIELIQETE